MCLGDENMLMKSEKKSKKRKKIASTRDLGVTKDNFEAVEHDLNFKEEKLSFVDTRKERDKIKMETKAPGESKDRDTKRKTERGGGKQPGKASKNNCEAVKNVVKKKSKLDNERETMHDALLDTKTIVHKTASETCDTEVVETLGEGYVDDIDLVTRKRRKKEKREKGDEQVDIVTGVNRGDVSTLEEIEDSKIDDANIRERKMTKLGNNSKDLTLEKSEIRVRFSGDVQVFPPSSDSTDENHEVKEGSLLLGKRFTREEDEIVKDAIYRYIEVHNLGEEGLEKIFNGRYNPEVRGCWKEIGSAIPYRPNKAVSQRAPKLFLMGERRKYTEEEFEMIRKYHREHGPKWKVLADELGRHSSHVAHAWHRIKLANRKKGSWSQQGRSQDFKQGGSKFKK